MGRHRLFISIGFLICVIVIILHQHQEKQNQLREANRPVVEQRFLLGTIVEIKVYPEPGSDPGETIEAAFAEMEAIGREMSTVLEDNPVATINDRAGEGSLDVPEDLIFVISKSIKYSVLTEGAFDITIGPLTRLWGFDTKEILVPESHEIRNLLPLVNYRDISISKQDSRVSLQREGMRIDLGAVAKGFAVDRAVEILVQGGIPRGIVTAGGDLRVFGHKFPTSLLGRFTQTVSKLFPGNSVPEPWKIAIRHPREDGFLKCLKVESGAVATSGDYQNCTMKNGRRFHHLLDPASGMPAPECISVTVAAPTALEADILSTGAFVMGPRKGMRFLETLPEAEGLFCSMEEDRLTISHTPGLSTYDCE